MRLIRALLVASALTLGAIAAAPDVAHAAPIGSATVSLNGVARCNGNGTWRLDMTLSTNLSNGVWRVQYPYQSLWTPAGWTQSSGSIFRGVEPSILNGYSHTEYVRVDLIYYGQVQVVAKSRTFYGPGGCS